MTGVRVREDHSPKNKEVPLEEGRRRDAGRNKVSGVCLTSHIRIPAGRTLEAQAELPAAARCPDRRGERIHQVRGPGSKGCEGSEGRVSV